MQNSVVMPDLVSSVLVAEDTVVAHAALVAAGRADGVSILPERLLQGVLDRSLNHLLQGILVVVIFLRPRQCGIRMTTEAYNLVLGDGMLQGSFEDFDAAGQADVAFTEVHPPLQGHGRHEPLPAVHVDPLQRLHDDEAPLQSGVALDVLRQRHVNSTKLP